MPSPRPTRPARACPTTPSPTTPASSPSTPPLSPSPRAAAARPTATPSPSPAPSSPPRGWSTATRSQRSPSASPGAAATAQVAGSPYAISASNAAGSGLSNYTITYDPGQLTVNPAALTITASSSSKTYGQTSTFAGTEFTTSGLVNGDSVNLVSLSSPGAAATAQVAGSPYAISASNALGSGLSNYTISYDPGQLTVNPAALTITASSSSKTYGQTVTFAGTEFTTAGLVNSDSVISVSLDQPGRGDDGPGRRIALRHLRRQRGRLGPVQLRHQLRPRPAHRQPRRRSPSPPAAAARPTATPSPSPAPSSPPSDWSTATRSPASPSAAPARRRRPRSPDRPTPSPRARSRLGAVQLHHQLRPRPAHRQPRRR